MGDRNGLRTTVFEGSAEEWDRRVGDLGHGTFCHLSGWRAVLADTLGHETFWWSAIDESGTVVGILPLARVRSRLFGDYLVSMPFLNDGGPLGEPAARLALGGRAAEEAARLGVDLLELRARVAVPGDLAVLHRKLTVIKRLPASAEELWDKGLRSKVRSQVRRPIKEGMTTRFGAELVDDFYDVFSRKMRDLGTPVLTKRFFEAVARVFPAEVVFAVVDFDGRAVAAACGFHYGDEFEITWAGSLTEFNREAPNMLLYWSLMEESIRRGVKAFNFGRCSPDSPTYRFKRQWGGDDHPLPWAQWSPRGAAAMPNPDSPKFRLATSVWSRLPLRITNVLGPWVSRSLP
jgi:FemAB-related protein (PEP-CTERM system-associated)